MGEAEIDSGPYFRHLERKVGLSGVLHARFVALRVPSAQQAG
ncbi:MAG: hypothetical protein ACJ8OJ_14955 [Povalibacter sp.]